MTNHIATKSDPKTEATAELVSDFARSCLTSEPSGTAADFSRDPKTLAMHAAIRAAFPDAAFELAWQVVEGERAALGGRMRGTHLGEWRGIPATGRCIDVVAVMTLVCENGQIVDMSTVNDSFEMAVQLGLVDQLGPKACQLVAKAEAVGA